MNLWHVVRDLEDGRGHRLQSLQADNSHLPQNILHLGDRPFLCRDIPGPGLCPGRVEEENVEAWEAISGSTMVSQISLEFAIPPVTVHRMTGE